MRRWRDSSGVGLIEVMVALSLFLDRGCRYYRSEHLHHGTESNQQRHCDGIGTDPRPH